jgi:hypothetical protein
MSGRGARCDAHRQANDNVDFTAEDLMFVEALGNTAISDLKRELFRKSLKRKGLHAKWNLRSISEKPLQRICPSLTIAVYMGQVCGRLVVAIITMSCARRVADFVVIADVSGKGMPAACDGKCA